MAADAALKTTLLSIALGFGALGMLLSGSSVSAQVNESSNTTVAGSVEIPENVQSGGVAWYNGHIWHTFDAENPIGIREVDPTNGQSLSTIGVSQATSAQDIAAGAGSIWVLTSRYSENPEIYQVNPSTGEVEKTLPARSDTTAISVKDGNIWMLIERGYLVEVDPDDRTEQTNVTLPSEVHRDRDMDWGDNFLWFAANGGLTQVDVSSSSATVVDNYELPFYVADTLAWDGDYMWVGRLDDTTLTRFDLGDVGTSNTPPDTSFTFSPMDPIAGNQVNLDASNSTDSEGYIQQFQWDFDGDGISDAQGRQATYVFDSPGQYRVELTATDNDGAVSRTNQTVNVSAATPTPTQTLTPTQTATSTTTATAAESTTLTTTAAPRSTSASTRSSPSAQQPTSTTQQVTPSTASTSNSGTNGTEAQRGFFNNSPTAGSASGLSDPFIITLGGFVFSALGIVLQLFRDG